MSSAFQIICCLIFLFSISGLCSFILVASIKSIDKEKHNGRKWEKEEQ